LKTNNANMETLNKSMWSWPLATRFVNEHRLPIPVINEELFWYHLTMFDEDFCTVYKWNSLIKSINNSFGGNPANFIDGFYEVREEVIQWVKNNPAYQKFNNMDMNVYAVDKNKYKQRARNIYNEGNIGTRLISIDLRKANFQAMNYVDREIMGNSDTYEEFIRKHTDIPLIVESKYFRQVIFGQLNPSRVFTVETYMVYQILDFITNYLPFKFEINSINADEIVISYNLDEYRENSFENNDAIIDLPYSIMSKLDIEVHVECFFLEGYNFYSNRRNRKHFTFYAKNFTMLPDSKDVREKELMCVNGQFFSITYKLMNNLPLCDEDYHFNNCDVDCIFNDTFRIEKI